MDGRDLQESKFPDTDGTDKGLELTPKEDITLGDNGVLSPKLKMMLERYGTDNTDECVEVVQKPASFSAPDQELLRTGIPVPPSPPPCPIVAGVSSLPSSRGPTVTSPFYQPPAEAAMMSPTVPPPPPLTNNSKPTLDLGLADAISKVRLRRASLSKSTENKVVSPSTPPGLHSPGNMGSMMSDLNKKLLARKKAAEASAIHLPHNRITTTPKFNAKMNEMMGTPPATPSSPFRMVNAPHTPTRKGAEEPFAQTWRNTSTSDPTISLLDLSSLKEELSQVIKQEVHAAKEDIIKNELHAMKEDIIKTICKEFQIFTQLIPHRHEHHDQQYQEEGPCAIIDKAMKNDTDYSKQNVTQETDDR